MTVMTYHLVTKPSHYWCQMKRLHLNAVLGNGMSHNTFNTNEKRTIDGKLNYCTLFLTDNYLQIGCEESWPLLSQFHQQFFGSEWVLPYRSLPDSWKSCLETLKPEYQTNFKNKTPFTCLYL